jgi:pimeloyl-ACP methyl ester carboxylesterase
MTASGITTARLDVAGLGINYLETGDPAGEPVLLLHGGGLTAYTWLPTVQRLAAGLRCVMPDLQGHGDSDWTPDGRYTLRAHADGIAAFLKELGISRCIVVGMSLGGQVAMRLAADGYELRALALVDVGPTTVPRAGAGIESFMRVHTYPSLEDALDAAQRFSPHRTRASLRNSLSRNMVAQPDGHWSWKWDPRRRETLDIRRSEAAGLWDQLPGITCPVLIVRGADSDVFSPELAARTAGAFDDARLVTIPDAGHTVQGDNPDALANALSDFIDEVRREEMDR